MIEDKAWFIKGLRNLSDNVKGINYHRSNSLFAIRAAREDGVKLNAMHGLPEVVAWHKFKAELCEELNAAVSVGNDGYQIELASCRKLAIAMESSVYRDEHVVDAIAELSAAADKLERDDKTNEVVDSSIELVEGGIRIRDEIIALRPKAMELLSLFIDARGEYVSMADAGFRRRDIENLPEKVQAIIDTQPGAGTRIFPKWFN